MAHVHHRVTHLVNLVEDEIAEQLDDVTVSGFGPPLFPAETIVNEQLSFLGGGYPWTNTNSGRSFTNPSFVRRRTSRAFSSSASIWFSRVSAYLKPRENIRRSRQEIENARKAYENNEAVSVAILDASLTHTSSIVYRTQQMSGPA